MMSLYIEALLGIYSISLLLVLTSVSLLTSYHSLCIAPRHFTGNLSNATCVTLNKQFILVFSLNALSLIPSKPFLTSIRLVVVMISALLVDSMFFLVIILFLGAVKSKRSWLSLALRLKTKPLQMQLLKWNGCVLFYMSLELLSLGLQFSDVTTLAQHIHLPI